MAIPEIIKQSAKRIRDAVYGGEVQESLAKGLEDTGELAADSKNSSDVSKATVLAIQEKYKEQILAQDLNPNKDPELVDLRGGKATAGERMTAFEQSTTAQFQQIAYNVKTFGIKGDGETDDSEKIQFMYDTIPTGSNMYFPKGIYLAKGLVFNRSDITISGAGKNNSFIKLESENESLGFLLKIRGTRNTFSDIAFDGGLQNVFGEYLVELESGSNGVVFKNCFLGNIKGRGKQTIPETWTQYALRIDTNNVTDFKITNCVFKDVSNLGDKLPTRIGFCGFIFFVGDLPTAAHTTGIIENNTFDNTFTEFGLDWTQSEKDSDRDGDAIRTTLSENTGRNDFNILIKNNKFKNIQKRCIKLQLGGFTIDGNTFSLSASQMNDTTMGNSCVDIRHLEGTQIINNIMTGDAHQFCIMEGVKNVLLKNNIVRGKTQRISLIVECEDVSIEDTSYFTTDTSLSNRRFSIRKSRNVNISNTKATYHSFSSSDEGFFSIANDNIDITLEKNTIEAITTIPIFKNPLVQLFNVGGDNSDSVLDRLSVLNNTTRNVKVGIFNDGEVITSRLVVRNLDMFKSLQLLYNGFLATTLDAEEISFYTRDALFENIYIETDSTNAPPNKDLIKINAPLGKETYIRNIQFNNISVLELKDRATTPNGILNLSRCKNISIDGFNYENSVGTLEFYAFYVTKVDEFKVTNSNLGQARMRLSGIGIGEVLNSSFDEIRVDDTTANISIHFCKFKKNIKILNDTSHFVKDEFNIVN